MRLLRALEGDVAGFAADGEGDPADPADGVPQVDEDPQDAGGVVDGARVDLVDPGGVHLRDGEHEVCLQTTLLRL